MKKIHIAALAVIAVVIAILISQLGNLSSYETIASARAKPGKTVTIIAKLDTSSIQYDMVKNPNLLAFQVSDTLGEKMNVVYYFEKPMDMEKSERIVLKGKMENGVFQIRDRKGILIKCPSKYKDDPRAQNNNLKSEI
ncbi:MAG: cytochrome c maturation protein CcmE [Chitinophagaceae bacterium]|jgi:cytochrome c-type biogenesis protein CcmE|nr:cytochrome c maturation protein CcmE [Chitinophagaceae bacterium]